MSNDSTLKPIAETVANLPLCPCAAREEAERIRSKHQTDFVCGFDVGGRLAAENQIRRCVRQVVADEQSIGVLSTGEKIAVAFVLNRPEWLECSMLWSVDRLGAAWLRAAFQVQRDGWE